MFTTRCIRRFSTIRVNNREYRLPGKTPIVGICIDGCAPEYLEKASAHMPAWQEILARNSNRGNYGIASAVMPTYTNPNNAGIITGGTPKLHGICGNYFFDETKQEEVMMSDASYLTCPTILSSLSHQEDVHVIAITAKDKLRRLIGEGLNNNTSFAISVENANSDTAQELLNKHNFNLSKLIPDISPPDVYDPECSLYAIRLGIEMMKYYQSINESSIFYISTTDYVQHKHAPESKEAIEFYKRLDNYIYDLDKLGAIVGVTADHGMNSKTGYNGKARVIYLKSILEDNELSGSRVILPITDPYLLHHSGLGSYATVYMNNKDDITRAMTVLREQTGIYMVINKEEAIKAFDLPGDRIGDIVIVADDNAVVGSKSENHDLSLVEDLRSHGGLDEMKIPMFINRPLSEPYAKRLTRGKVRNYDLFDYLLNGIVQ